MVSDINLSSTFARQCVLLNSLTKIIDVFADKYDNYLIMGDFNLESGNTILTNFST